MGILVLDSYRFEAIRPLFDKHMEVVKEGEDADRAFNWYRSILDNDDVFCYVIEIEGRPIAYCIFTFVESYKGLYANILQIYTEEKRIGRKLFEIVKTVSEKAGCFSIGGTTLFPDIFLKRWFPEGSPIPKQAGTYVYMDLPNDIQNLNG